MKRFALLAVIASNLQVRAQENATQRASWNEPVKPFRVAGNVYHVGVAGVTAFLITTPAGSILLDGGFLETAPLIERNIETLGLRLQDVRLLLNSHAHYDHCGGLTELKKRSGAKLVASAGDSESFHGRRKLTCLPSRSSRIPSDDSFSPPDVDRVIGNNESVELGGVKLTAHLTPGHTRGCTTWTMKTSGDTIYNVLFYCSTTVAGNRLVNNREYPNIVSDYEKTFAKLRSLQCDVFLAPHGSLFHRDEKIELLEAGRKDAFVNSDDLKAYVDESERAFREELARQRGNQ